ncbi:unnamed protein product [Parnassius apollo]|uniref:(apollo) hypothetical protein n=1 Tax=Parnassius apollo TaxID=110799 RepID=A0A8S3WRA5_PARAO|nr:unnamed protein product [Parnassius apollo]
MCHNHSVEVPIGLDPARPLVSEYGSRRFRLDREDAHVVQVLHTNAGFLGEVGAVGHADFCINGGQRQPGCRGHFMRRSRCSHFMSSCYLAASIRRRLHITGVPCDNTCPKQGRWGIQYDRKPVVLGDEIPDSTRGMFCAKVDHAENCPFD